VDARITVIEVFRALGIEPERGDTWAVGAAVAREWEEVTGTLPILERRPKTSGKGSHAISTYPEAWRVRIAGFIQGREEARATARSVQLDLFKDVA
jgi:hypothetical protein